MKLRHIILAFAIIIALGLPVSTLAAESETQDDWLTKLVDTYYDAVDSYNNQIIERNLAVSEASGSREEWHPSDAGPLGPEATGLRFIDRFNHYDELARINDTLANDPDLQQLINDGLKNMAILSSHNVKDDDPRWKKLNALVNGKIGQKAKAEHKRDQYLAKRDELDEELQKYRNKRGSYPPHACSPAPLWHRSPGVTCMDEAKKGSTDSHGHSDGHGL